MTISSASFDCSNVETACEGALACELAGLAEEIMADIANYTDLTPQSCR